MNDDTPAIGSHPIRLTRFAKRAGCAAKQPPGYLLPLLGMIPTFPDANVLVGSSTSDDAAVYRLNDDLALVLTTDFFTPVVDRPYEILAVAAANCPSDVYAMGANPWLNQPGRIPGPVPSGPRCSPRSSAGRRTRPPRRGSPSSAVALSRRRNPSSGSRSSAPCIPTA